MDFEPIPGINAANTGFPCPKVPIRRKLRLDLLQKFAEEAGMLLHLLYEVESEETHPVKFEIFELLPPESTAPNRA
jgi:hypothetical protein